jgi:hypothetical protein
VVAAQSYKDEAVKEGTVEVVVRVGEEPPAQYLPQLKRKAR